MSRNSVLLVVAGLAMTGCVTSHVEDARETVTGIGADEAVVIMAKSYHQGNETESDYVTCVERSLSAGSKGINVVPHQDFVDELFPWFEPRTAPGDTKGLPTLMDRPGVRRAVNDMGVRYIVWLDGDTERVAEGGSLSCAAGPGGGGCFGFAWWQNDADYTATVWDLDDYENAGSVTADVSGTSFLPALVVPIPLIARAQNKACKGLAGQLRNFITQ